MTARVLAIDIGKTSALALLGPDGELLDVGQQRGVDAWAAGGSVAVDRRQVGGIMRRWAPTSAVVEYVSARPKEAPSGAFSFGRSKGVIEGVLGSQAIPVRFVTPAWWKRRAGIPPGAGMKDVARSVAIAKWPAHAEWFARVKDHDRPEACLIGLAHITAVQTTRAA